MACAAEHAITLWDWEAEREIHKLAGHTEPVTCVAFSPDRKTLASASEDETVRIWDLETGKERVVLRGHSGKVYSLAFADDGQTLITGSEDKTVRLWRAASERDVRAAGQLATNRLVSANQSPVQMQPTVPTTEADWQLVFYEWKQTGARFDSPPELDEVVKSQSQSNDRRRAIDFDWGQHSFKKDGASDYFALVAKSSVELAEGEYALMTVSDDGVRVYLDDQLKIDNWVGHGPIRDVAKANVKAGKHDIRIEYFELMGPAKLQFGILPSHDPRIPKTDPDLARIPRIYHPIQVRPADWQVSFYPWKPASSMSDVPPVSPKWWEDLRQSRPLHSQRSKSIDFKWGTSAPASEVPSDFFVVVATAEIELAEGKYTLMTWSDDGVRVYLDGDLVVNDWTRRAPTRNVGIADVKAGKHDIRIEYFEAAAGATLQFGIFPAEAR